jgi:hypothetical protein
MTDPVIDALIAAVERMERHARELRALLDRAIEAKFTVGGVVVKFDRTAALLTESTDTAIREILFDLDRQAAAHLQLIARMR